MNNWRWTAVLEQTCPECEVDVLGVHRDDLGARFRVVGGAWRMLLERGGDQLMRQPPGSRTWSVIAYGCHVRDAFGVFEDRLRSTLKKRKPPTFSEWDPDQAAIDGNYTAVDPGPLAYALATQAGRFADLVDHIHGDEWWERRARFTNGREMTVEEMTRYVLHEAEHHLWDAREILAA